MQGVPPVNVKHGVRSAMGKVGGYKKQKRGILMYYYKFAVIGEMSTC